MVTNFFPIGNVTVKGIVVCMVAGSFVASLWLTNNHVELVSNITCTANLWVYIDKYKRPRCILMLLNCESSTFSAYRISTGYISFPAPSWILCLYYLASPSYYWVVACRKAFACCGEAYMVHLDSIWLYIQFFYNCSPSVPTAD